MPRGCVQKGIATSPYQNKIKLGGHKCGLCDKRFPSTTTLNVHIMTYHTKERPFKCSEPECDKSYSYKPSLQAHVNSVHTKSKLYPCQFANCGKTYTSASSLKQHCKTKHSQGLEHNPIVSCTICSTKCKKSSMWGHLKTHNLENNLHSCNICGKTFSRALLLSLHKIVHLPNSEKPVFQCSKCDLKFCRKTNLNSHFKVKHGGYSGKKACAFCHRMINDKSMESHLWTHTGERPYSCGFSCGRNFTNKYSRKIHEESVHIGKSNYSCSFCFVTFEYEYKLKHHEARCKRPKQPTRSYPCLLCDRIYTSKNGLDYHKNVHMGEKNHKCSLCRKTFLTLAQVKMHAKIHTNERPYACTKCHKAYPNKGILRQHEFSHLNEEFPCEICEKVFSAQRKLKRHKLYMHEAELNSLSSSETINLVKKFKCRPCSVVVQKLNL